jgi:tetratricopeptide (TPR) repeat protein
VYYQLGDIRSTLADLKAAEELNPNNTRIFQFRGNIYYDKKQYERALVQFRKVIELEPQSKEAEYCIFSTEEKLRLKKEGTNAIWPYESEQQPKETQLKEIEKKKSGAGVQLESVADAQNNENGENGGNQEEQSDEPQSDGGSDQSPSGGSGSDHGAVEEV